MTTKYNTYLKLSVAYIVLLMIYVATQKKGYFYAAGGVFILSTLELYKKFNNPNTTQQ